MCTSAPQLFSLFCLKFKYPVLLWAVAMTTCSSLIGSFPSLHTVEIKLVHPCLVRLQTFGSSVCTADFTVKYTDLKKETDLKCESGI